MAADALSFHEVFVTERVWIDLIGFGLFALVHLLANVRSPGLPEEQTSRTAAFTFVTGTAGAGLTAAGLLLPLSLAAVGTFAPDAEASTAVLRNIFIGDAWIALSLVFGLALLWGVGFRAHSQNVQNFFFVRLFLGLQLAALVPGIVRLLIATFLLVES